ncbi:MAG: hypothetical protein FJ191_01710 [Gammaproteobacteria bacterium]|nr:hypothetical protein [Gammaproteobacteria bacterium]
MKPLPETPGLLRVARRRFIGTDECSEVLERAPPGVFDARSWAYWNLVCGRVPPPPLPERHFPPLVAGGAPFSGLAR